MCKRGNGTSKRSVTFFLASMASVNAWLSNNDCFFHTTDVLILVMAHSWYPKSTRETG